LAMQEKEEEEEEGRGGGLGRRRLDFLRSWQQSASYLLGCAIREQDKTPIHSLSLIRSEYLTSLPRLPHARPSPLQHASDFKLRDFKRFDQANRPFVLRGDLAEQSFKGWPQQWQLSSLVERWGEDVFTVLLRLGTTTEMKMKLSSFVDYMKANADLQPLYLFESDLPKDLQSQLSVPKIFEENFLTALDDPSFTGRQWLLIGGAGSGLSFHVDPFGCSAWNALLQGRKRWILYPPHVIPPGVSTRAHRDGTVEYESPPSWSWYREILPSLGEEARPSPLDSAYDFVQEAGDIVYIPRGWWHCVVNLEETVAYTQNIVNRRNVKEFARQIGAFEPEFADRVKSFSYSLHD